MKEKKYIIMPYLKLNPPAVDFVLFEYQKEILLSLIDPIDDIVNDVADESSEDINWKKEGF